MVYPHIQYGGPAYPDSLPSQPRELDSRTSDAVHVRLLWHGADGYVSVAVEDTRTGEAFEVRVGDGERALDVFHHPYAYADRRRESADSPRARLGAR